MYIFIFPKKLSNFEIKIEKELPNLEIDLHFGTIFKII